MYLSPTPTCLRYSSEPSAAASSPNTPYSSRVRKAATTNPLTRASDVSATSKAPLIRTPRAARRLIPT
jgi:hypothetical protein